jgi:hypothetical protein
MNGTTVFNCIQQQASSGSQTHSQAPVFGFVQGSQIQAKVTSSQSHALVAGLYVLYSLQLTQQSVPYHQGQYVCSQSFDSALFGSLSHSLQQL